jgi:hypothetical protein
VNPYRGRFGTQPIYLIHLTFVIGIIVATGKHASAGKQNSFPIRIFGELPAAKRLGQLNPGSFTISK